jgi:hypothetical protein
LQHPGRDTAKLQEGRTQSGDVDDDHARGYVRAYRGYVGQEHGSSDCGTQAIVVAEVLALALERAAVEGASVR